MSTTISGHRQESAARATLVERFGVPVAGAGLPLLRWALVAILLYFGAFKFASVEAEAIRPLVQSSPFLSWMYAVMSPRAASAFIGVTEIAVALLLAARPFAPRLAGYGGLAAAGIFLVTVSFLATTPGMWASVPGFPLPLPSASGSFLVKDVFLFAGALAVAREAFAARKSR